jgi:cytochrome P450
VTDIPTDPAPTAPIDDPVDPVPADVAATSEAPATAGGEPIPTATVAETVGVVGEVLVPLMARGLIVRRPNVVAALERGDGDRRAVARLQRLRRRYGRGPVRLRIPGRELAVVLDPDDAIRVLAGSPEPFVVANEEKRSALAHFQPRGVLASHGRTRAVRRQVNEMALESQAPLHPDADAMLRAVHEEADELLAAADRHGELDWSLFIAAWYRIVRRVTLGDGARDDHQVTDDLAELRGDANWSFLARRDRATRDRFHASLRGYLDRAEPGSLAARLATARDDDRNALVEQIPQWLFAFEPAGMAAIRALALLAAHPSAEAAVRAELADEPSTSPAVHDHLRAAVLESLRLWPTTPGILRDTSSPTVWRGRTMAAGTAVVLHAPFFHRDDEQLAYADRFAPELWLGAPSTDRWPLVPFSGGPGVCPGRNVVLFVTSELLAAVLRRTSPVLLDPHPLHDADALPSVLDPFALRFGTLPAAVGASVTRAVGEGPPPA